MRVTSLYSQSKQTDRAPSLRSGLQKKSKSHDVVAAVHVDGLTGDPGAEIGGEKQRGIANFPGLHISFQRRMFGVVLHHCAEIAHAAGRQSLDRPSRDGIHPNLLLSQTI